MPLIQFRCWYCNKRLSVPNDRIGDRMICTCKQRLRVPAESEGSSRDRSLVDWLVEFAVYGGGGAILGMGLGFLIVSRTPFFRHGWAVVLGLTIVGLVAGGLGGERGINWIGQKIRDREQR